MQEIQILSWVEKMLWSRKCQPTSVFLPGKLLGQRSLADYSPWGHKELGMTEWSSTWGMDTIDSTFTERQESGCVSAAGSTEQGAWIWTWLRGVHDHTVFTSQSMLGPRTLKGYALSATSKTTNFGVISDDIRIFEGIQTQQSQNK